MKRGPGQVDLTQIIVAHFNFFRIAGGIEFSLDGQAAAGTRAADQVHDDATTGQGLSAPVQADGGEHAVLDLVPLASPKQKIADPLGQPRGVGAPLQGDVPESQPVAVAATPIGGSQ